MPDRESKENHLNTLQVLNKTIYYPPAFLQPEVLLYIAGPIAMMQTKPNLVKNSSYRISRTHLNFLRQTGLQIMKDYKTSKGILMLILKETCFHVRCNWT